LLKTGVQLSSSVDDVGEYLADARALEAAGADSLWADRGSGLDPWMLLAGLAVVTGQVRLGISIDPGDARVPDVLGDRLAALQRLSRMRAIVRIDPAVAHLEDVVALVRRAAGDALPIVFDASNGKARPREQTTAPVERWALVAPPESRAAWRETRRACEAMGAQGVIVPFGPRLLDLLRRPDEEDDRSDLLVAQG
jgi:hypothetical protein